MLVYCYNNTIILNNFKRVKRKRAVAVNDNNLVIIVVVVVNTAVERIIIGTKLKLSVKNE